MDLVKHILEKESSKISLSFLIEVLNRDRTISLAMILRELGISYHEHQFLFYLYHEENTIQEEFARLFRKNESTITRALKKLEEKNLIKREPDENNRRKNIVSLTEKGIQYVEQVQKADQDWEEETLSIFSSKGKRKLKKTLKKIAVNSIIKREDSAIKREDIMRY